MKKILVFLSFIFIFLMGLFSSSSSVSAFDNISSFVVKKNIVSIQQVLDVVNDGVIQSYSTTEEHYFLSKNEQNNHVNITQNPSESQLGFNEIKSLESFNGIKILSHSNDYLETDWVYLTQASPRAP